MCKGSLNYSPNEPAVFLHAEEHMMGYNDIKALAWGPIEFPQFCDCSIFLIRHTFFIVYLCGLWKVFAWKEVAFSQDDKVMCGSKFQDPRASLGTWADFCLFPGHTMWQAISHLLSSLLPPQAMTAPKRWRHRKVLRFTYVRVPLCSELRKAHGSWNGTAARLGIPSCPLDACWELNILPRSPTGGTHSCCHGKPKAICGLASCLYS